MASPQKASIVLGGGCFWCLQAYFKLIRGILSVTSGYAGGNISSPSYNQVSRGETGHAEVVKIEFDPAIITLEDILKIFWTMHDPTTLNRQGADVGTQYRSIVLTANETQFETAKKVKEDMQRLWDDPIITEIKPLKEFFPAEDYHQDYYAKNPSSAYCQIVINPKLNKLKEKFGNYLSV